MARLIALFFMVFALPVLAQSVDRPDPNTATTGPATQSLDDILRRQDNLKVDDSERRAIIGGPEYAPSVDSPLGTRGGASDSDLWRAMRFNNGDISTQNTGPAATVLMQDAGMWWLDIRRGPLQTYGAYLLGGTLLLLALFLLIRGRIRIEGEKTGRTIERFKAFERFGHWLLASSFIVLAITGLISLFGRKVLIPAFGHDAFSTVAIGTKWVHNNISWAFMVALVMIFFFWVMHNLPDKTDLKWLAKGGGIFGGGHPPAKKFNAGQKLIFWAVIVLGGSISISGLSLLFPFEINLFAHTFDLLNGLGAPGWVGMENLPSDLSPQEEMQYAQLWHAIISFVLTAIIFAHIYLGSVGMEGAFDAMGKGEVEEQWAREHHSLWVEEVKAKQRVQPGE
ncbi:formate dehydrogenase subunit gamma [Sulfitobacter sabulilitoris]|uniref:Formate dehydrogenase subunit gamma n=1 Tax=Sulfitobacter sabulilitoris TaxID=2562655 RepID=A0A5S3PBP3_9RHOB|nr:formate dehydrogenase subunit gamma [Sulfitobacter sabulilitoris]TMM51085.1 formate dehydrogenase subunit gamma [Sulfitobacter sabulilitoris]